MEEVIQVVIQGGAVGLAALAIGSLHIALRAMTNHMPHMVKDMKLMSYTLETLERDTHQHHLDTVVLLAKLKDRP